MQDDPKKAEPELHADAWERFERAVDVVAKSAPQPRTKSATPKGTQVAQSKKARRKKLD
jgi:hypothetical protein